MFKKGDGTLPAIVRQPELLISIMGEQTHPSLILAGKLEQSLKHVVLLGTKDVKRKVEDAGAAIAKLLPGVTIEIDDGLPPYNWRQTEEIVGRWIRKDLSAVLDLTGGTKPMTIGAYRAGTAAGLPMVYVDTRDRHIHSLGEAPCPVPEPESFPEIRATVLLRARGFRAACGEPAPLGQVHRRFITGLFADPSVWASWTSSKQRGSCTTERNAVRLPENHNARDFQTLLEESGLAECRGPEVCFRMAGDYRLFTTGIWLERYVADEARKTGAPEVLSNWKCFAVSDGRSDQLPDKPDYEFDVVLRQRSMLYFISCKTGKVEWEDIESFANAVRYLGGIFAKGALATLQPLEEKLLKKAQRNMIMVWDARQLSELRKHIQTWLQ